MKRKLRTRIGSILLTAAMLLSLLPATALAVSVGGTVERVQDTETWYSDATKAFDTRETYWNDQVTKVPESYSVDDSTKTVSIGSAEALVWWAKQVNGGTSFADYTVNITADLDLSAHYWTPICTGTVSYDTNGKYSIVNNTTLEDTTINGNGHEIIGLATQTGVRGPNQDSQPGDGQNCYYDAAFIGYSCCNITIEDLIFEGARIAISKPFNEVVNQYGSSMLAVVVGAQSGGSLTLTDVTVNDADVLAMQKASAFVGNLMGNSTLTVEQCAITNSRFSAYFMVAPIASYGKVEQVNVNGIELENNTVRVVEQSGSTYTYDEETGAEYWEGNLNACATALFNDGSSAAGNGTVWTPVAEVNGYLYDSLTAAVADAKSGETITLLRNAEQDLPDFTGNKALTLDLNTYTLTIPVSSSVCLKNGANLAIKNGAIVAKAFTDGTDALFNIQTGSAITLDNVDVDTTASALFPQGDAASVTVQNGSTIKCGVYAVGTNAATTDNYKVVITLKDSTFTSTYGYNTTYSKDSCPVMINVEGTLDIDNCTITGTRQGVIVRAGTATIDNSTIKSTGEYTYNYTGYPNSWGSGDEVPAAALVVGNYQNGAASAYLYEANVTLTNTTVIAENSIPALYVDANATYKGVVSISGSESYVSGAINNGQYTDKEQISITITGGTFSADPTQYLATGYAAVPVSQNGPWTVEASNGMVAEVGTPDSNGTVSAEVGGNFSGDENDNNVVADENGTVTITATTDTPNPTVSKTEVTINNAALTSVANEPSSSVSNVAIKTDVGTVTLDKAAWDTVTANADGDSVVLSVEENNKSITGWTVTAATPDGDTVFSTEDNPNGTITISVPYTENVGNDDKVVVYYISNDGTLEAMDTTYASDTKTLTWTTNHLSSFAGVVIKPADEVVYLPKGSTLKAGTLNDAIAALTSSNGGSITLVKNIENLQQGSTAINNAVITLPAGTTLNGAGYTITAGNWDPSGKFHILGVNDCVGEIGNEVVVKNLTIVGNETTKHGFNAYGSTNTPDVTLENVTIKNCGTAAVVVNHANVTAINLTTSGNAWGAVNVDKSGALALQGNANNMAESVKIWTEASSGTTIDTVGSNYAEFEQVTGVGTHLKGHTYYTDDVSDLGVAYNKTTKTIYETLEDALDKAVSGNTVTVVKNTKVTTNVTVNPGVTLVVNPDVTLNTNDKLTNNGTIENNGTINGKVIPGGSGSTVKSSVTFSVMPSTAAIVVKDNSGATINKDTGSTYLLENGTYSYTVSANGYYTKTGTFTVSGSAKTITVSLDVISTDPDNGSSSGGNTAPSGDYIVFVDTDGNGRVILSPSRADKGDTVTITVKPDKGYDLDELTVTDNKGKTIKLTSKGDNQYTFEMPGSEVTVEASFVSNGEPVSDLPFYDVSENDWFYDAVVYAYENELMSGTSAHTFAPNSQMTRAMIWTVLAAYEGENTSGGATWYEAGQKWAMDNGISDGTNPNGAITREQLAVMLWRYAGSPKAEMSLASYTDASAVSSWAVDAMAWAIDNGLISGMGNGILAPQGNATRAQVATIMMQFVENI